MGRTKMADRPPSDEVAALAQKLMKAAGKQDPVLLMHALLLCMQMIDSIHNGPRKQK